MALCDSLPPDADDDDTDTEPYDDELDVQEYWLIH